MRQTIESAPKDQEAIILEDDASGIFDVAHWSPEAGEWISENGDPSKITPTHWQPLPHDRYLQPAHPSSHAGRANTQAVEPAAPVQPAAADAHGNPEAARLMARASTLLAQGNIGAARIVLERAAETGSARANFMLAETYDPVILSMWGTYGTRGEATKARELYAKAHAGGIEEAKNRLDALTQ
jgi:hypothetical protein